MAPHPRLQRLHATCTFSPCEQLLHERLHLILNFGLIVLLFWKQNVGTSLYCAHEDTRGDWQCLDHV